ncbi:MAG: PstC family ABC transporter permease [Kiritimatiellia bacterium]
MPLFVAAAAWSPLPRWCWPCLFGLTAAICLSDILPFRWSEALKPAVEMLAAIPSVAYGFFALVILAPLLQNHGPTVLRLLWWSFGAPGLLIIALVLGETATRPDQPRQQQAHRAGRRHTPASRAHVPVAAHRRPGPRQGRHLQRHQRAQRLADPGPDDAPDDRQRLAGRPAGGRQRPPRRQLRAGRHAGPKRWSKSSFPAAGSGILSAIILGCMRAIGETMVVWMASGNAAQIPEPWYNLLQPVRTITATIAGDMGEADQMTGSARYHVLFALGLCLLLFSLVSSGLAERAVARQRRRLRGE